MKVSISNIAWDKSKDEVMYDYLVHNSIDGLEIAPTRFIENNPYDNIEIAIQITESLKNKYNLSISSMQSIWFGRNENIFRDPNEFKELLNYTKKAVNFAAAINCPNLVFGCPKNRYLDDVSKYDIAIDFFREIGEYAYERNTTIALEPNPIIYNTNFINTTNEAFDFIKKVQSKGLLVNLDLGTIIWNNENLLEIFNNICYVNHIHISEPNLLKIEKRDLHNTIRKLLIDKKYDKYISIEMKNYDDIKVIEETIQYINEVMR